MQLGIRFSSFILEEEMCLKNRLGLCFRLLLTLPFSEAFFRNEEIMVFPGCPKIEQTAVKKKGKENKKRLTGWSILSPLGNVYF